MNDAVGLVLFEAFAHLIEAEAANGEAMNFGEEFLLVLIDVLLNFGGSLILGFVLGLLIAYCLKVVDLRHHPLLEVSSYTLIMYAPFVLAEICRLSGIVTVLFTGLAARRYAEPNLSIFGSKTSDTIFRLVSHMTETLIFLELGLSVIPILRQGFNVVFVSLSLAACLISRALNVYPLVSLYNLAQTCFPENKATTETNLDSTTKTEDSFTNIDTEDSLIRKASEYERAGDEEAGALPLSPPSEALATPFQDEDDSIRSETNNDLVIPRKTTHFLFLSGLRGAVSYGLVKMFPDVNGNKVTFEVTTMLIVLITTFVFGGMTEVGLTKLNIPVGVDESKYMRSLRKSPSASGCMGWWRRFDDSRLRPFVVRDVKAKKTDGLLNDDEGGFVYQEQVEVTEREHDEVVKKGSIFDFGQ